MKKIIICCDGTWSKPGTMDRGQIVETNVEKIYHFITCGTKDQPQVKYYGEGVGTGFTFRDHFMGGSFGVGLDGHIWDAYKFLMWNYKIGDHIYLFGFSRGAYTVRSLAGLIRNCGILRPEFLNLVSEAYHLYRDRSPVSHPDSDLMKSFKSSYSLQQEIPIEFIGVWDTVGSLGIPLNVFKSFNKRYEFHDVKLSSYIKNAYQALAVDEKREYFKPALWQVKDIENAPADQNCEQVWFPGVHSNVGGGYLDSGISDIALDWMIEKAKKTGLQFDEVALSQLKPESTGEIRNSATGIFKITPKRLREINSRVLQRKDNKGNIMVENINTNESIHLSCFERVYKIPGYKPRNVSVAYKKQTPLNPMKEKWKKDWLQFLNAIDDSMNTLKINSEESKTTSN